MKNKVKFKHKHDTFISENDQRKMLLTIMLKKSDMRTLRRVVNQPCIYNTSFKKTESGFRKNIFRKNLKLQEILLYLFKTGLSPSKEVIFIYINERSLKMMKNGFYFMFKSSFLS